MSALYVILAILGLYLLVGLIFIIVTAIHLGGMNIRSALVLLLVWPVKFLVS